MQFVEALDCAIKTREMFNFPLKNNSVTIGLNFYYEAYQPAYHKKKD